jgi:hypothetical protein
MRTKTTRFTLGKIGAGVAAVATAGAASAGELATAVTDGIDKGELTLIGVGVLAVCGIIVLIKAARRASGG